MCVTVVDLCNRHLGFMSRLRTVLTRPPRYNAPKSDEAVSAHCLATPHRASAFSVCARVCFAAGRPLDEGPPPRRFLARELDRVWPSVLRSSKDSVSFLASGRVFPVDSRIFEPSIPKLHLSPSPPSRRLSTSLFLPFPDISFSVSLVLLLSLQIAVPLPAFSAPETRRSARWNPICLARFFAARHCRLGNALSLPDRPIRIGFN